MLKDGTLIEVLRSRAVSEVLVVQGDVDVPLRRATYWERWRFWWRTKRQSMHEVGAAIEAGQVIEKAKRGE